MSQVLSDDQRLVWAIIAQDPEEFSHRWGTVLKTLHEPKLNDMFDQMLAQVADFELEDACRILKTVCSVYEIPIKVFQLENFDDFYKRAGDYIMQHKILPFERE